MVLAKLISEVEASRYLFNGKFTLFEILELRLSVDVSSSEISSEISTILSASGTF